MQHKHKHKHHAITQHKHKHNDVTTKRTQTVQSQATCCFVVDHGEKKTNRWQEGLLRAERSMLFPKN